MRQKPLIDGASLAHSVATMLDNKIAGQGALLLRRFNNPSNKHQLRQKHHRIEPARFRTTSRTQIQLPDIGFEIRLLKD